jgi:hypothetical protein
LFSQKVFHFFEKFQPTWTFTKLMFSRLLPAERMSSASTLREKGGKKWGGICKAEIHKWKNVLGVDFLCLGGEK